jgi:hypothetical protein
MNLMRAVCTTILLGALAAAAADLPFMGKWKFNMEKSDFTGTTVAFEQTASGEMQMTAEGQSYKFKVDGKEYPAPFGAVAAWKQVNATTWQATYRMESGTPLSTETTALSADGKMLVINSKGKSPDGQAFDNTTEYERVSGGAGLAGKWKSSKAQGNMQMTLDIQPHEGDGIAWKFVEWNAAVSLKFDGKDYTATGPTVPPNFTLAARKTGASSFDLIEKMNGKVVYRGSYTVSPDGKTMTVVARPEGTQEKATYIYERQ